MRVGNPVGHDEFSEWFCAKLWKMKVKKGGGNILISGVGGRCSDG